MKNVQIYTAIFDIGRSKIDGRSLKNYQDWLYETLNIFPDILVFHDGSAPLAMIDERFIQIERKNFLAFQNIEKIKSTIEQFSPLSPSDITFQLPEYGAVQFSKFQLGTLAVELSKAKSVLWVDAGISRFLPKDKVSKNMDLQAQTLILDEIDLVLEIDLRKNINFLNFKIKQSKIGSCRRIFSGTSFWINSSYLPKLNLDISRTMQGWLERGVWDNEQVMLRHLNFNETKLKFVIQGKNQTGNVARQFQQNAIKKINPVDKILKNKIKHLN